MAVSFPIPGAVQSSPTLSRYFLSRHRRATFLLIRTICRVRYS